MGVPVKCFVCNCEGSIVEVELGVFVCEVCDSEYCEDPL